MAELQLENRAVDSGRDLTGGTRLDAGRRP